MLNVNGMQRHSSGYDHSLVDGNVTLTSYTGSYVVSTMAFDRSLSAHYSHLDNSYAGISRNPLAFVVVVGGSEDWL